MAEDEGFVCSENYLIFSVSLKEKTGDLPILWENKNLIVFAESHNLGS